MGAPLGGNLTGSGRAPTALPPSGPAGGDLAGTYPNPTVVAIEETSTPARLAIGAIPDGAVLKRDGATVVGDLLWNAVLQEHFGDGSDGVVVVNAPLALVRDMYYDVLTPVAGSAIACNANALWCLTLDLINAPAGAIRGLATPGVGGTAVGPIGGPGASIGGAGQSAPAFAGSVVGATGTTTGGVQSGATQGSAIMGGWGGNSQLSGAGAGGAGAAGRSGQAGNQYRSHARLREVTGGPSISGDAPHILRGGGGGASASSGAGDGATKKGGGGGSGANGAGMVYIYARTILVGPGTAAGCIIAHAGVGGNGGNGEAGGGNTGGGSGGSGGGGGSIVIAYYEIIGGPIANALQSNGGQGGNGGNGAVAGGGGYGAAGGDGGTIILVNLATGVTTVTTGSAGTAAVAPFGTAGSAGGAGGTNSVAL